MVDDSSLRRSTASWLSNLGFNPLSVVTETKRMNAAVYGMQLCRNVIECVPGVVTAWYAHDWFGRPVLTCRLKWWHRFTVIGKWLFRRRIRRIAPPEVDVVVVA